MPFDCLITPIPTGRYTRIADAAPGASATNISNCGRFAVDANARQSHSFFPRMTALVNNTMRHLGLMRRSPVALVEAQNFREIYERFRDCEKTFRMLTAGKYQEHFARLGLSTDDTASLHACFSRNLDRHFLQFPDTLRKVRAGHVDLDLPAALCKAYEMTVAEALASMSIQSAPYRKAMAEPIRVFTGWLKKAITPLKNLSSPGSTPAAASASPVQINCETFRDIRSAIFEKVIAGYEEKFASLTTRCIYPSASVDRLREIYSSHFDGCVSIFPREEWTMGDLKAVHREAMNKAVRAAVDHGIETEEIARVCKDTFIQELDFACKKIDAEIARHREPVTVTGSQS